MQTRLLLLLLALLTALSFQACGDEDENDDTPAPNNASSTDDGSKSFATFNAGLARGFVPYAAERIQPVTEAIAAHDSDVLCVQEVWFDEEIDAVLEGVKDTYHHSMVYKTESDELNDGCGMEEAEVLADCVREKCSDVPQDQLGSCGIGMCGTEFSAASVPCQTCVAANLHQDIDAIIATCEGGGPKYSSGGRNGLILLSKHELKNQTEVSFTSNLTQRAAIRAEVEIADFGTLTTYCTHLAADLSNTLAYPADNNYSSFGEEQAGQIDELLAWIDAQEDPGRVLIMGDINTGPALGELTGELPENFEKFEAAGWVSVFAQSDAPQCTFCLDNTIETDGDDKLEDGSPGVLIDHIFADSDTNATVKGSARVFDQLQEIAGEQLHLSDHYGVQVTLLPEESGE